MACRCPLDQSSLSILCERCLAEYLTLCKQAEQENQERRIHVCEAAIRRLFRLSADRREEHSLTLTALQNIIAALEQRVAALEYAERRAA
jgi:hypothetical protein